MVIPECWVLHQNTQEDGWRKAVRLLDQLVTQDPKPLGLNVESLSSRLTCAYRLAPLSRAKKTPPVMMDDTQEKQGVQIRA